MRFLIQRVRQAKVEVAGQTIGEIGRGLLVFVGVSETDMTDEFSPSKGGRWSWLTRW